MWKEEKLNNSGRKWSEDRCNNSDRCAELFCEECGISLGVHDIVYTNLESTMYCAKCVQKYIKSVPVSLQCGVIREDFGDHLTLEYTDNYYKSMAVDKVCYFNKKGRYIKVKGKRYYV